MAPRLGLTPQNNEMDIHDRLQQPGLPKSLSAKLNAYLPTLREYVEHKGEMPIAGRWNAQYELMKRVLSGQEMLS